MFFNGTFTLLVFSDMVDNVL